MKKALTVFDLSFARGKPNLGFSHIVPKMFKIFVTYVAISNSNNELGGLRSRIYKLQAVTASLNASTADFVSMLSM